MADVLISDALIVTMDNTGRILEDGGIAIEGNKIVDLGKSDEIQKKHRAEIVLKAKGKVVTPGFICTHTHMAYTLGHDMPVDFTRLKSFWDMLQKMGWEWLEDITTKEGIYASHKFAAIKMIKSGVTTICDMVEGPNALPGVLDYSAKAIDEVGIRAQVGFEVTERIPRISILERLSPEWAEKGIEENLRFVEKYGGNGRIKPRFGVHTAFTNSDETLRKIREIANEKKVGVQIHVAEIPAIFSKEKWGKTDPQRLEDLGFLGPDVLAVHCVDLPDEDLNILAKNDVKIAHTPMTNALGGNGVARVPDMLEKGMTVSLGHDCFFSLSMPEYIRFAYLIHKAHRANPLLISPIQALEMVTVKGAKALGVEKELGSIEVGKTADLIIVNPNSPTPVNKQSVISYIISNMTGGEVETSIIDGKIVMENREVKTVDEEEARKNCLEEAKILWRKNNIQI